MLGTVLMLAPEGLCAVHRVVISKVLVPGGLGDAPGTPCGGSGG